MKSLVVAAVCTVIIVAGPARADLLTPGTTKLISPPGVLDESSYGRVSGDGLIVAFDSEADAPELGDANGSSDVYLRDLTTGALDVVSVGEDGTTGSGYSRVSTVSRDGRFVAFASHARLTTADTNTRHDAYVRDRALGVTTLVSPGDPLLEFADRPATADDGATVAFEVAFEGEAIGVSVWHRATGLVTRLARYAERPSITADGTRIAFYTELALVPEDLDDGWDVYTTDAATGAHTLVTGDIDAPAFTPDISADGRRIAFMTLPLVQLHPAELHVRDLTTGETKTATPQAEPYGAPAITRSGDHVTYVAAVIFSASASPVAPQRPGVYVWDWRTGETSIASTSSMGTGAPLGGAGNPTISDDGRFIAFDTPERLAADDDNAAMDVYLRDRVGPCAVTCLP